MLYRLSLLILALLLLSSLPLIPAGAQSVAQDKDLTAQSLADAPQLSKSALVIGIDDYRRVHGKLTDCVNDANAFADLLRSRFGFTQVTLMTDDATNPDYLPTYTSIRFQMKYLIQRVLDGRIDQVVVFFSGHGSEGDGSADWLVPSDGDPDDTPAATYINYTDFKTRLEHANPARAVLVVDACRTPSQGKGTGGSGFGSAKVDLGPQFAELLSCRPHQESMEGLPADFRQSVFTHFLIQGLSGDPSAAVSGSADITFDSLMSFVRQQVSQYVHDKLSAAQDPDGNSKLGSMLLARRVGVTVRTVVEPVNTIARLCVTVRPAGATLYVDGLKQSSSDVAVDLGPDKSRQVEVDVAMDAFLTKSEKVTLNRGQDLRLTISLNRKPPRIVQLPPREPIPQTATLTVTARDQYGNPVDGTVTIDPNAPTPIVGETNQPIYHIVSGAGHQITLTSPGYVPSDMPLPSVETTPVLQLATLTIDQTGKPDTVYINNEDLKASTPCKVLLPVGDYSVKIVADGYAGITRFVHIDPSQVPAPTVSTKFLDPPTGINTRVEPGKVAVSWNSCNGATSYNIYREVASGAATGLQYLVGITGTSYCDSDVTPGTTYYYTASAVSGDGESPKSGEVSAVACNGDQELETAKQDLDEARKGTDASINDQLYKEAIDHFHLAGDCYSRTPENQDLVKMLQTVETDLDNAQE